jgi:CMP-N,N'-diacetyllegionaminic acid synthase
MLAPSISEVIVATDDDEIAEVAEMYGAGVFRRSAMSATDSAPSEAVLREVVMDGRQESEAIVFLQATSPIRQPDDIENAIAKFRYANADSLFSARTIEGYTWAANGRVMAPCWGPRKPRQQEQRECLEENGSIYVFKPFCLLEHGNRLAGKVVPYLMNPLDSFQIDEPCDIPIIESLMEIRLDRHEPAAN